MNNNMGGMNNMNNMGGMNNMGDFGRNDGAQCLAGECIDTGGLNRATGLGQFGGFDNDGLGRGDFGNFGGNFQFDPVGSNAEQWDGLNDLLREDP